MDSFGDPGEKVPLIPGDPERQAEQERREKGVPLIPAVFEELRDISSKTGIPFPARLSRTA
jgi:L-2-hydroxycarboxylate dehydrogenase (NAD+)